MLQSPKQIAEVLSRQYPKLTWYISHEIQHHSAKYSTSTDRFKFDFQKSAKKQSKRKFFYLVNFYINFTSFVAYSRFLLEMMFITTLQLRYIFLNENNIFFYDYRVNDCKIMVTFFLLSLCEVNWSILIL